MSALVLAGAPHLLAMASHLLAAAPTPGAISPGPVAPFPVTAIPPGLGRGLSARGWLESVWVCVAIGVLAVIAGYAGVFLPLRGRAWKRGWRGRLRTASGVIVTISLLLLSVAAGVNSYAGYLPSISAVNAKFFGERPPVLPPADPAPAPVGKGPKRPGGGASGGAQPTPTLPPPPTTNVAPLTRSQLVQLPLHAPDYGLDDAPAYVYLPPGYAPTGPKWPVLVMIGGAPGSTDDWVQPGNINGVMDRLIHDHIIKPFVIVMPTTNPDLFSDDECLNSVRAGRPRVESYLIEVVMPAITEQLNVSGDRHLHAIAGFSAGADCALNVGLRNLSLFSAIGTIEAQGRPGFKAENRMLDGRPDLIRANSPIDYIPTMTFDQSLVVYLNAAGSFDTPANDQLQRELQGRGVYVYRHDEKGFGHNWRDAREDLPWLLSFMSSAFNAPTPTNPPLPGVAATPTP